MGECDRTGYADVPFGWEEYESTAGGVTFGTDYNDVIKVLGTPDDVDEGGYMCLMYMA